MQKRLLSYPLWLVITIVLLIAVAFVLEEIARFLPLLPLLVLVGAPHLILVSCALLLLLLSPAFGLGDVSAAVMFTAALGAVVLFFSGALVHDARDIPEQVRPVWRYLAQDLRYLLWLAMVVCLFAMLLRSVSLLTALGFALQYGVVTEALRRTQPRQGTGTTMPIASVVLMGGTILLCAMLLEFTARVLVRTPVGNSSYYMPDRDYLYRLVPGFEGEVEFWPDEPDVADTMHVKISSLGIRDREYSDKKPGEYRILFLGDSYTFGWGLEFEDTLERVVERDLHSRYPDRGITVINGGTGGYGPWQTHGTLRRVGNLIAPDLVIMQTNTANDISDTLRKENKFLKSFVAPMEKAMQRYRYYFLWQVQFEEWLRKTSRLYFIACRIAGDTQIFLDLYNQCRLLTPVEIPRVPQPDPRPWNYEPDLKDWYPELEHGWRLMQDDLLAIRANCEALGAEFALYNMPNPFDIVAEEERIAEYPGKYDLDKNTRIIASFCATTDTAYIPVLSIFRDHPNPATLYFHNDGHLNPAGAELLGKELASFIGANYLDSAAQ